MFTSPPDALPPLLEQNERNKAQPRKIGMAPEQGKGIEYEFDMLMELNEQHNALVSKDRTGRYQDQEIPLPDETFGAELIDWLNDGADIAAIEYAAPMQPAKQPAPIVEITTNPETEILEIKKAISGMLTKMVNDNVDGFGDETRRHNSFTKHLNSDTVRDCTDYNALLAYHDHLAAKLRGETANPTIKQRQDALIDRLTAMPIMAEELEEWGDKIRNATRHAALDEVEEWITKYEVKQ